MAEPKTKAMNGNGNHISEKATTEQSKLWQMLSLAKEVAKDVDAIQDYEKTVEGRRALEIELENRNTENQRLREVNAKVLREFADHKAQATAHKESLFSEFEKKFKTYESNKTAVETMAQEVADMKEKLDVAETSQKTKAAEVAKLKQQLKTADANAKSQAAEIREMNADSEMHRSRMEASISERDAYMTKLSLANGDLGEDLLHDYGAEGLTKLGLDLKALSKNCHNFVLEYFNDAEGAKDSAGEIQELKARFPKIPLTTSTSRPASQMRCAAAEAVIAEIMMQHIFVPFYLSSDFREAASKLLDMFGSDERRRTVYRCQILRTTTTDTEETAHVQEEIVRKASHVAIVTLYPLVASFRQGNFNNAVPGLFREALALWADVQRSRDVITAKMPDANEVQPPSKYDEYDQSGDARARSPKGSRGAKPAVAAVLFPQVATREDVIFNGMALWSNQGAVTAALHEAAASASASSSVNGEPVRHANRRRSDAASPRYST